MVHMLCLQDVSARLAAGLSAIEQYAVRFMEEQRPIDIEGAAAAALEEIKHVSGWEAD
jgi:hypothetical protein